MRQVALGTQGLQVSRIGLGCMGVSDFYKGGSEKESRKKRTKRYIISD